MKSEDILEALVRAITSSDVKRTRRDEGQELAAGLAERYINKGLKRATNGKFPVDVELHSRPGDHYVGFGRRIEF